MFKFKTGDILYFSANKAKLWDRLLAWVLGHSTVHCAIAYVIDPENPLMFEALPKSGGIFLTPVKTKMPTRVYRPPHSVAWSKALEEFNFGICNKVHYSLEDGFRARIGLRDDDPNGWICSEHIAECLRMMGVVVLYHGMTPDRVEQQIPKDWEVFNI